MKKLLYLTIFLLIYMHSMQACYAAGDPSTYKITIQKFEMQTTDDDWVTISESSQEIDIVSVSGGAVAGTLGGVVPAGTYDNFRLTISETIKVTGNDGANYTNQDGVAILEGDSATAADIGLLTPATFTETSETWNNSSAGEMSIQVNLDNGDADNYMQIYCTSDFTPLTVTADSAVSMWVDFDTEGTVHHAASGDWGPGFPASDIMYFTPPNSGSAFSISVDGTTATVTAAQMTQAF